MNGWMLALALAVLCALQRLLIASFGMKGLQYKRQFSRKSAFEGEKGELIEVIRNDRPLLIPWLRAESRISPCLKFGRQENLQVSGERYHKSLFMLAPFQQITRKHIVSFTLRGAYDVGNVTLTLGDLLGECGTGAELRTKAEILVYPRLLSPEEMPLPVSRLQGEWTVKRHWQSDPFLINGIREYRAGDPVRDIHWPATARMNALQVKTHDYTADTKLLILLNGQMTENQWGDLMDYEQALIERAISISATLCVQGLKQGMAVGFGANMPVGGEDAPALFLPSCYPGREEELLSAFARLRIKRCRSFLTFLGDLSSVSGADILILSAYDSPDIQEKMGLLRRLGNTVTLYRLDREAQEP